MQANQSLVGSLKRVGLMCSAALLVACAAAPKSSPVGTFSGQTFSGSGLVASETSFSTGPAGELQGSYWLAPEHPGQARDQGQLSDCRQTASHQMRCQWRDRFGSGVLEISFNPDFSAFDGRWGNGSQTSPALIWNGQRVR